MNERFIPIIRITVLKMVIRLVVFFLFLVYAVLLFSDATWSAWLPSFNTA